MTNDQSHPEHAQDPREPMNIAALLRAAADGEIDELSDAQRAVLDGYLADHPEGESQIGFERAMRQSCSRSMSGASCPEALRAKVIAIADAARQEDESYANRIADAGRYTRSKSFWSRSPMLGAAAALLIVTAGALIWQSVSFTSNSAPSGLNIQQANYYNRVSDFVVREHTRCCDDKAAQAKLVEHDIGRATEYFSQAFGHQVSVPDMEQVDGQIEFFGGGDCSVPSTPRSGHLRFDAIAPDGQRISLSLFISPDPGLLPLEEGLIYTMDSEACAAAGTRLFAWVSDGLQYLLVSEADDEMCAKVRGLMQAPTTFGSL
jgi:hypothetical protein